MVHISFALLEANNSGASIVDIAARLNLPEWWVQQRIETARLSIVAAGFCKADARAAWSRDIVAPGNG